MTPIPAALERLLRSLPPDRLFSLADAIRRAALLFDRGRPDEAMDALAAAVDAMELGTTTPSRPTATAIDLLDRARYDLEQGWSAAAYDAAARATRLIASMTTTQEIHHVD